MIYRRHHRRGLTLLEMLLVLALLVIITAIAIPNFQGTMTVQRLRNSGDLLRSQMGKARVRAMKTGQPHAMWIEASGSMYRIEPWATGAEAIESAQSGVGGLAGVGGAVSDPDLMRTEDQLPEGIVFYVAETVQDNRAMQTQQASAATGGVAGAGGAAMSNAPPIIFYPDGTTSSAKVAVTDGEGLFVVVSLRGLTGIAKVSEPVVLQELAYQ